MPFDQDDLTRQLIAQLTQPGQATDPQAAQPSPFEMAAQHTRQSVMPFGGRGGAADRQGCGVCDDTVALGGGQADQLQVPGDDRTAWEH